MKFEEVIAAWRENPELRVRHKDSYSWVTKARVLVSLDDWEVEAPKMPFLAALADLKVRYDSAILEGLAPSMIMRRRGQPRVALWVDSNGYMASTHVTAADYLANDWAIENS